MATVADHFAATLQAAGVKRVYGLPGGENVEILDAIRRRGLEFVLVRNESSACFMAATEARLRGTIGVALTTLGPGAANAVAGLAHAHLDRAPVLMITATSDPDLADRHTHQALDLAALFQPICKFSAELTASNAARTIHDALRLAVAGRPGPVHLGLHNRIARQEIERAAALPAIAPAPRLDLELDALNALLSDKRKPIIVAGLGLAADAPYDAIRELAETLRAPLIDTPKSKGLMPADHPLFAGTAGLTRADPVYELLDEADCIVAIGFDVVELVKPWDYDTPLVWIAAWENRDPPIPSAWEAVGPVSDSLDSLADLSGPTAESWGAARVKQFRDAQSRISLPAPRAGRILPQTFLAALREYTPDDMIVTTDVGSHKIFAALNWPARAPNRYFVSNGLSAMGFGLCSAIAAAAVTGEPAVCITGDAGLAMVIGELGLLAERRLPVLVFIMNDAALDLIRSAQLRAGRAAYGTEFQNPDFELIAGAYGIAYRRVETRAECDAAIQAGLSRRAPMLIDVMLDPVGYPTTVRKR
ncbi:MAG: thiamine pyrophosphate-binding protein [Chloroflexi bacterium]|nr:thiamine pyrophosphate-binding protein [Chloroflexota bacterium]